MKPLDAFEQFHDPKRWHPDASPEAGCGNFGRWTVDDEGLPAYDYGDGSGADTVDHWHLLGNDAITATAHVAGHVQLYDWSRGGKIINRHSAARGRMAGGYCHIAANGHTWSTRHADLPDGAAQTRRFGAGHFARTTVWQGVTWYERIAPAPGDAPALVQTITVCNHGHETQALYFAPYWQPCLHQLTVAPIMTHGLDKVFDAYRARLNRKFTNTAHWESALRTLRLDWQPRRIAKRRDPRKPSIVDHHPASAFFSVLDLPPGVSYAYITDGESFFGDNANEPVGLFGRADYTLIAGAPAHTVHSILTVRIPLTLPPGGEQTFRFAFGYARAERVDSIVRGLRGNVKPSAIPLIETAIPDAPGLGREAAWHSVYLQAGSLYSEFYDTHFIDQGSAYSYMQGGSGAPRDIALFILPLIYLRPDLARECLRFLMRSQCPNGAFPYAWFGHGMCSGGGVHSRSSDLDLFFAWALSEYLLATRDLAFLKETQPYYPPDSGKRATVLDHAKASFRHLRDDVGIGPHGLIRSGTGDWNDVLLAFSRMPPLTILRGESTLNAGLATFVLPALADAVTKTDAVFANDLRTLAGSQREALQAFWTGKWVARGYPGYGKKFLGSDSIFLDTQAFGVLGDVWSTAQREILFDSVEEHCTTPQGVGGRCLWPPMRGLLLQPGSDTNGGTWAAIDSWIAWAWAKHDPAAAWKFFQTTTLRARAEAYPECWYGVWSGPDAYNAHHHPRPAETFNLNATPMSRYPIMNMNRHSGPLLDLIKFAGFRPAGDAFVIDPLMPCDNFAVRTPLAGCAYSAGGMRGHYRCTASGDHPFAIRLPKGNDWELRVDGNTHPHTIDEQGLLRFVLNGSANQTLRWEITGMRNA